MNENELKMLEELQIFYMQAISVCDPIEFQKRQQGLLYSIAKILLTKLDEHYEKIRKENKESDE
jgi:hypothetical protein